MFFSNRTLNKLKYKDPLENSSLIQKQPSQSSCVVLSVIGIVRPINVVSGVYELLVIDNERVKDLIRTDTKFVMILKTIFKIRFLNSAGGDLFELKRANPVSREFARITTGSPIHLHLLLTV